LNLDIQEFRKLSLLLWIICKFFLSLSFVEINKTKRLIDFVLLTGTTENHQLQQEQPLYPLMKMMLKLVVVRV